MKKIIFFLCFCLITSCYVYRPTSENNQQSLGIEKQIQPEKRYQILSEGNKMKIKAVAWEGDSLVAETGSIKKKTLKFHKNQISSVENRVFSRGRIANLLRIHTILASRSLIHISCMTGPETEPWRTLLVTSCQPDVDAYTTSL